MRELRRISRPFKNQAASLQDQEQSIDKKLESLEGIPVTVINLQSLILSKQPMDTNKDVRRSNPFPTLTSTPSVNLPTYNSCF